MHQRISKRIFIYLFIFISLGTLNNHKFDKLNFAKIDNIKIYGLSEMDKNKIYKDLESFKDLNLFFLDKQKILEVIKSFEIVESFFIFKNYPSDLNIKIKKTEFLAIIKKDNTNFYIGSNGNLIKTENYLSNLPIIFGEVNIKEFLRLKKIIDNSNFRYEDIQNLYYFKSKRWDIQTKDDLVIKLPIDELKSSFEILMKIYKKNEFKNSKLIDLRQKNQIVINGK